jgi:glycosyltransferase involved in cell wall biosynthesis
MKILIAHNHYQQYGGEDAVVQSEIDMLKKKGHDVYFYERSNKELLPLSWPKKIGRLLNMHWSEHSYQEMKRILNAFRPDIFHSYNTFYMMTPAVYKACQDARVPVVQSLYNYRLVCANGLMLKNGKHCEACLTEPRWKSIFHRCYRKSYVLTACVMKMIDYHWKKQTWLNQVKHYITATEFSRNIFTRAGIPADKITVKPHFLVTDPGMQSEHGAYALYIGRISVEKGVGLLLDAWKNVKGMDLKIMGEGPLLNEIKKKVEQEGLTTVRVLGYQPQEEYKKLLRGAAFLIVPSINYDNFPLVITESYANGIPVLASSLEGIKERVKEKESGMTFRTGDKDDLTAKAQFMIDHKEMTAHMKKGARLEYETHYTSDKNYERLMAIYQKAIHE